MKLKERAKKLKSDIPAIYFALTDKRTPWYAKALAAITIGYALSPVDLIPDFIPVLGYLDDLLLLPALAALVIRLIPKDVMDECRVRAEGLWENGKPKRWYYAIPIVVVWIALACLIAWLIYKAVRKGA